MLWYRVKIPVIYLSNRIMYNLNLIATDRTKYEDLDKVNVSQEEESDTRKIVGRGVLEMNPFEFLKQMTTFTVREQNFFGKLIDSMKTD